MQQDTFTYNQGKIYFKIAGRGEPIVFIHGFSLDHRMWQKQVDFFTNKFQVITYDMRGFGNSSLPTNPYSHYDDLHMLLEHLQIKNAHVVGSSFGGKIVIDFALKHPESIISLSLLDSSLGGYINTIDWNVHAKEFGIKAAKHNWLNHKLFAATRDNKEAFVELEKIIHDYSGWHWIHKDFNKELTSNAINHLHEISVPTMIVLGEKDLSYYHAIADILQTRIAHSKKRIIANVGHMVNIENAGTLNKLLYEFIKGKYSVNQESRKL